VPLIPGPEIVEALATSSSLGPCSRCSRGLTAAVIRGEIAACRRWPRERWPQGPPANLTVRRIGGEQSNTSSSRRRVVPSTS